MDQRVNDSLRTACATFRHVGLAQFVEVGLLHELRPFQGQNIFELHRQIRHEIAGFDQALAIDECGCGELPHLSRRHERPWLHEKGRLHLPGGGIEGEMHDAVCALQRAINRIEKRRFAPVAVRAVPRGLGNHGGQGIQHRIHCRMVEDFRLAGLLGIKPQRADIRVCMPRPDRPGRILPLVIAAEVTMAVDEIARRVAVFFQGSQHVVVGRGPVGGGDQSLEAQAAQILDRVGVKLPLGFHQECRRLLVARSFFRKDFEVRAEPEATFGEIIPLVRHAVPCRKHFVQRTVLFDGPVAKELLQLAHLGVGHMVVIEGPEKERVLIDQLHAHERGVVHQGFPRRPFAGEDLLPPAPIKLLEFRLEIEQRKRRRFAVVSFPPPRTILRRHPEREVNGEVRVNPLGFRGIDDLLLVLELLRVDRTGFPVIKAAVHADHVDPVLGERLEGALQSVPLEFIGRAVDCPEPHRLVVLLMDELFATDLDEPVFTREFFVEKTEVDWARL